MRECVEVDYKNRELVLTQHHCYESRGHSICSLIRSAFETLSNDELNRMSSFTEFFHIGDRGNGSYCFSDSVYSDKLIPCFLFDSWIEVGIPDYEKTRMVMLDRSSVPPVINKLFWIGNTATHPTRVQFIQMCQSHPIIDVFDCGNWQGCDGHRKMPDRAYLSIEDHSQFKYLIDLQGNGWSARTKLLLHSGRPLFYQERKWNEYWFFDMEPFVHYIPVKEDLSDLFDRIEWAETHPEECWNISKNAVEFSRNNLGRINAIERFKKILLKLGEKNEQL